MKASDSVSSISFPLFNAVPADAWPFSLLTLGGAVLLLPQTWRDMDGNPHWKWSETVHA